MVTLTIDPKWYSGPEAAFLDVRDCRAVACFVQALKRAGYLHSSRYFYVVEWQGNGWPHWHLVLDASFIPFDALCLAWNRMRPAGPVAENRPGYGSVRFTKKYGGGADQAEKAAKYVSKYLSKYPEKGYPDWVLDARYRIRRYSASRGFWGTSAVKDDRPAVEVPPSPPTELELFESLELQPVEDAGPVPSSIRERLGRCGSTSAVFRIVLDVGSGGEVVGERRQFVCRLLLPLAGVREALWGAYDLLHPYCVRVDDDHGRLALGGLCSEPGLS